MKTICLIICASVITLSTNASSWKISDCSYIEKSGVIDSSEHINFSQFKNIDFDFINSQECILGLTDKNSNNSKVSYGADSPRYSSKEFRINCDSFMHTSSKGASIKVGRANQNGRTEITLDIDQFHGESYRLFYSDFHDDRFRHWKTSQVCVLNKN